MHQTHGQPFTSMMLTSSGGTNSLRRPPTRMPRTPCAHTDKLSLVPWVRQWQSGCSCCYCEPRPSTGVKKCPGCSLCLPVSAPTRHTMTWHGRSFPRDDAPGRAATACGGGAPSSATAELRRTDRRALRHAGCAAGTGLSRRNTPLHLTHPLHTLSKPMLDPAVGAFCVYSHHTCPMDRGWSFPPSTPDRRTKMSASHPA